MKAFIEKIDEEMKKRNCGFSRPDVQDQWPAMLVSLEASLLSVRMVALLPLYMVFPMSSFLIRLS